MIVLKTERGAGMTVCRKWTLYSWTASDFRESETAAWEYGRDTDS